MAKREAMRGIVVSESYRGNYDWQNILALYRFDNLISRIAIGITYQAKSDS